MKAGNLIRWRHVVAVAVALALGACGGGDGDGGALPSVEEDKARAERMLLTDADLPGLTLEADEEEDDESDPFQKCLDGNQVLDDLGDGPRGAEATYEDESLARSSAVVLAESVDDAKAAFAVVEDSSFVACFEDAVRTGFEEEVGEDADIDNVEVVELSVEGHGDETVGYRASLDLVGADQSVGFSFDYVFFRVDRAVGVLFGFDVEDTFDAADRDRLSEALTDKMEREL